MKCKKCGKEYKTIYDFKVKNIKARLLKTGAKAYYFCDCGQNLGEVK